MSEHRYERVWRHPVAWLVGTLLIGALGSGLWETVVRPGVTWSSQKALDLFTFGSESVKDEAYRAAALDQTAAPAARVYSYLVGFFLAPVFIMSMFELGRFVPFLRIVPTSRHSDPAPGSDTGHPQRRRLEVLVGRLESLNQKLVVFRRVLLVVTGLMLGFIFVQHMIHEQSLLIWRSFHADLKQCAPFMTADEQEAMEAHYAAMKRKSDYSRLVATFQKIADQNNLELHSAQLW